ncbi:3-polyprenyl-4-hydroxybenzoate carboxy-lyase UbiX [Candidatus Burkholderia crenata]|nr:3-polyprenyl-4-hydroxybenzoate carboxy-lyase UbiX [Candidatus Burkholderia crenata]
MSCNSCSQLFEIVRRTFFTRSARAATADCRHHGCNATGSIYGVRLLETLRCLGSVETHLLISSSCWLNIQHELDLDKTTVHALANVVHNVRDVGASIALGLSDNLITRAVDVVLKERRRLVLMVRKTPFNLAHLRNMTSVTEMGGVVFPPLPAF